MSSTKWKIQTAIAYGWADIKCSSDDGESYVDDHYDTRQEARSEIAFFIHGEEDGRGYRVVKASVPQDDDLYE
jgi:hypothetical protein